MKLSESSRSHLATIVAFVAAVMVIIGLAAVPNSWVQPEAEAAGPAAPTSGAFSVTSTVSPSTLPYGGGEVTVTYTVRNLSTEGNKTLFYVSDSNSVCSSLTSTGMVHGTYEDYIAPGGTATFTCTANVRETTDIKQSFTFSSYDAYVATGDGNEAIQLTGRVTVSPPPAALGTCDTPWFTSAYYPSAVGFINPTTGAATNKWRISFVTSRPYQERNASGQLLYWAYDGYTGTYYKTTTVTSSPVMLGTTQNVTGSSGFAIDPTNPQFAYFGGRDGDVFNNELYRMDLLTGTITSLGASPAFSTNRLSVDANGTLWSFANDGILYSVANVNELKTDKPLDQYGTSLGAPTVISRGVPTFVDPITKAVKNFATLQSGDIAFDGNGTMYVLAAGQPDSTGRANTLLLTIDSTELTKSSGIQAKAVGYMGYPTYGTFFNGLAFDTNGTLYATSTDGTNSSLYTIDVTTGRPTIKTTSNNTNITWGDLASCALPTPRLVVTKTAAPSPVLENGVVTYTIQVKNIGDLAATGATLKDLIPAGTSYVAGSTRLNGVTVPDVNGTGAFVGTREVHGTRTTTAGMIPKGDTATVTFQVKVAAGQTKVCNQGEVNFTTLGGAILTDDPSLGGAADSTCVDVMKPSIQVVKLINGDDANTAPGVAVPAGQDMTITFEVTNTGNAPLAGIVVTDDRVPSTSIVCDGSTDNTVAVLNPGRSVTCTAKVPAPAPGEKHSNTGTVEGAPSVPGLPAQPPVSDTDQAFAFTPTAPSISISKLINDDPADTAPGVAVPLGQLMNIKFVVTNTGTSQLSNVTVTDDKVDAKSILCPKNALAPGEQMTCTAALMAPEAGVQHLDTAKAVAKPALNPDGSQPADVTATNPAYAYVPVTAKIDVVKLIEGQDINSSPGVIVEPGKPLAVTFEVTNQSNAKLTDVTVTDDKLSNVSCPKNVLAIGEKMTCTATLPALKPGENHINTATVVGTPPTNLDGTPATPVTDSDVEYARAKASPAFELIKKINGDDANLAPGIVVPEGKPMNVTFEVKNTGNLPLIDVAITDDKISNVSCPATTVAVGQSMTCTATMPAPEPNTQHTNTATLTVTPQLPDGSTLPPRTTTDTGNAFVAATPGIQVVKKINGDDANTAPGIKVAEGSTLDYTFEVTNTGNVPLTGITVTDDKIVGISCPVTELAAGASTTCTATGPAPQPGVQHVNTATVSGQPPQLLDGSTPSPVTDTDQAFALVEAKPSLKIVKKINGEDANTAPGVEVGEGSKMLISFEVTNTGNVTLTGGKLVDDVYGPIECPTDILAPGYTTTCVTEQDAPAVGKQHTNTGTATGTPPAKPDGTPAAPVSASDSANATALPKPVPSIEITKKGNGLDADFAPGTVVAEGSDITFTFRVINTGNTELTGIAVNDDKLGAVTCPKTTLAAGEAMDCDAKTAKAPAPGELHSNLATVTANSPQGVTVTDDDPFNAYVENKPGVSIVKSINGSDANDTPVEVAEGSEMEVTFKVTNTGNVPLNNVVVGDNLINDITCPATTIGVGQDMTCTAKLAAPTPGVEHHNIGFVTADTPPSADGTPGVPVSADDPAKAIVPAKPSVQIVKKINGDDANTAPGITLADGQPMEFTFDVTNTGNVPLTNVVVTDDKVSDIACPKVELAPGETMQCTAGAPAPQPGVQHSNTAKVSANPPANGTVPPAVTDEDSAVATVEAKPSMKVTKFLNGEDANTAPGITVAEGSTMTVAVHVENTGNMPLMIVTVTDDQVSDIICPKTELAAGEDMYCLGELPAPASGVQHTNTATATGTVKNPDGTPGDTVTDNDPAYALGTDAPHPEIEVVKKINGDDANTAPGVHVGEGTTMQVTFEVTNIGNTQLRNIEITDDQLSNVDCPHTTLAAGATMTCTAFMAAPALGLQHENLATVKATEVKADGTDGATVEDTNPAFAVSDAKPAPSVSIIKRINGDDANTAPGVQVVAGATMNITFEVRNTGNTPLSNLEVVDPTIGGVIIRPDYKYNAEGYIEPFDGTLLPGEWTAADAPFPGPAAGGTHRDEATVTGDYTSGTTVEKIKDTDEAHAFAPGTPSFTVEKKINGNDADSAPGVKVDAGSTMNIEIVVTNTGDTILNDIVVTDDKIANVSCPATSLEPGKDMTCTATLPAPAANEQHTNTATVTAKPPANPDGTTPELPPVTDQANAYSGTFADLTIEKKINGDDADTAPGVLVTPGSTMNIEFVVTNTGSVKLSDVKVTDSKILDGISCPKTELASGETMTCTASYPAPLAEGMTHEDVATAEGTPPVNLDGTTPPAPKASDPAYAQTPGVSGIQVVKKINGDDANVAPGVLVTPGTPLDITFEVTNTGSVDLTEVKVSDDKIAADKITCPQTTLKAGESMTCTATVPALKNAQQHDNIATVTGKPPANPDGFQPTPPTGTDEAHAHTPGVAGIAVDKRINNDDAAVAPGVAMQPGETMYLTYVVTNTGATVLNDVKVTDDKVQEISCPKTTLAAGESMTCTAELAAPAGTGETHVNVATATGMPPKNPDGTQPTPPTATDEAHAYTPGLAGVEIIKRLNGDDADALPGVSINALAPMDFTFDVTNTGQVPLKNVAVTDDKLSGISCPKTELTPGEGMQCTAMAYAPADGTHTNTATVTATPIGKDGTEGTPVTDTNVANATIIPIPAPGTPGVGIVKKINGADANELPGVTVREGETMNVTIEVVNSGNALLRDVKVTDDKIANITCGQTELHVGETMICTGTMPAPKAGESHTNTATVTGVGVDLAGKEIGSVTDTDPANATSMTKAGHPAIQVVKKINGQDASNAPGVAVAAGSAMDITFEVTNTGDVELTDVKVTDDKVAGISCPANKLQPGESMTCTANAPAPAVGEQHMDVAKAVGTPTPNTGETPLPPVEDEDNANAYVPAIEVVKKINGEDANDAPVTVPADIPMFITFEVTNKGLAALTNVKVTDDVIKIGISCPKDALLPGETMICTATGDAPAEGTEHKNTATVTGEVPPNPDESTVPSVKDEDIARAVVTPKPAPGTPGVAVVKKINGDDANDAPGVLTPEGSTMDITFEVTNTGETKLINVSVMDDQASVSCPQTDLAIGETMVCTAQLPAPMAGQKHKNTATVTATGEDLDGKQLGGVSDTDPAHAFTPAEPGHPGIVIVKKINDQDASIAPGVAVEEGSLMDVTFEVTNTGDIELENVAVTDDKITGITCPGDTLQPGETMTCTARASAPGVGKQHTNVAKVTATPIDPLLPPVDDEDNANAYVPGVKVIKKINGEDADSAPVTVPRGVDMFVTFEVTNTGLAALHDVQVSDDVIATGITCPQDTLLPGESMLCYATLPAPADGVTHVNTATVTGEVPANPDGSAFPPVKDTNPAQAVVAPKPEPGTPAVTIVKKINGDDANEAPGARVDADSDMAVTFEVTNTGQTLLKDVSVTDDKLSSVTCPKTEIHVGETIVCTGTLKAPDSGKSHTNIGTVKARGYDLEGLPLAQVEDQDPAHAYALPKEGHPSVVIVKKINGQDASLKPGVAVSADADMTVTFEVTNNGDVDLTDVKVSDDKIGSISCPMTELKVGESMTCTATAKAPAAGEQHENVAKVVATPKPNEGEPQQPPVGDDDNAFAYVPAIEVIKMINGDDANKAPGVKVKPGTTMEVTFKVVNKGLAALNDIKLTDDKIAADKITCPKYDLLPGEEMTCRATIDTPADGVQHVNTATVVGQPPALADGTKVKPVEDTDVAHAKGTTKPGKPVIPGRPGIPWWIIPSIPLIGGLIGSSERPVGSTGSSDPGQPPAPVVPGQPGLTPAPGQEPSGPQKGIPGKGGLLAQTGVQQFGLAMGVGAISLLLGLGFVAWSKRKKQ